jgi:hypothetical protein
MSEFFAGAAIGFIAGMALVAYWCYPLLENLREENGKLKIDLQYSRRDRNGY